MFIIKGVNIFPIQVEQVLMSVPEVGNNYLIILQRENNIDDMLVQVEVNDRSFMEDMRHLQRLQKTIMHELRSELLVTPRVELVEANTLPRSDGKAVRLLDKTTPVERGETHIRKSTEPHRTQKFRPQSQSKSISTQSGSTPGHLSRTGPRPGTPVL